VVRAWQSDPIYNDPKAPKKLSDSDLTTVRAAVERAGTPMYVAVLPSTTDMTASRWLSELAVAANNSSLDPGTISLVYGSSFRGASVVESVADLATIAVNEEKANGAAAIIVRFIDDSAARIAGDATPVDAGTDATLPVDGTLPEGFPVDGSLPEGFSVDGSLPEGFSVDGSLSPFNSTPVNDGFGVLPWIIVLGGGAVLTAVGVGAVKAANASTRQGQADLAQLSTVMSEDVTSFGEQLAHFNMTDPRLDDAGRTDLQHALDSYARVSNMSLTNAATVQQMTSTLEEGRFALACVTARLEGQPLPQRRPPCFIDPRHGPSIADVMWAPDGGAVRSVPMCAADSIAISEGRQPIGREVPIDSSGRRVPYWQAGRAYQPYATGYYSSFGNVLPAMMVGTMLGSTFSHGGYSGSAFNSGDRNDSSIFGGGGSSGGSSGGGWSGGDFGGGGSSGGGWSGGDFGGGGSGGGDIGGGGDF
jgi:hypothetical protein